MLALPSQRATAQEVLAVEGRWIRGFDDAVRVLTVFDEELGYANGVAVLGQDGMLLDLAVSTDFATTR